MRTALLIGAALLAALLLGGGGGTSGAGGGGGGTKPPPAPPPKEEDDWADVVKTGIKTGGQLAGKLIDYFGRNHQEGTGSNDADPEDYRPTPRGAFV